MIFIKIISFLLIIHNTVESIDVSDIYDIKAVENFVEKLENKVKNNYLLTNTSSIDIEKNEILKIILNDMADVLKQLNRITSESREGYWKDSNMNEVIKLMDDHEVKSGISRWSTSLFDYVATMEVKRDLIDTYVRSFLFLHESDYLINGNNSCKYLSDVVRFVEIIYKTESIADFYKSFLNSISIHMYFPEGWLQVCGLRYPFNKELYDYYRLMMTPYIKIWTMNYYSEILKVHCANTTSNSTYFKAERTTLIGKFTNTLRLNKKIMIESNKHSIYRCDDQVFNDINYIGYQNNEKPYYELEKMIQAVVINERKLSKSEDCSHNCDLTKITDLNRNLCEDFTECQYITYDLNICEAGQNDTRSYQWFKDDKGVVYGNNQNESCNTIMKSVKSYYQSSTLYYCNICVCSCRRYPENKPNVVTAISFRDQESNIKENMVVVGVRFVKKDHMIHVQIKEKKLDAKLMDTVDEWKELENIVHNDSIFQYQLVMNDSARSPMTSGLDYGHPVAMNFDNLTAPPGHVVTGVRFRFAGDSLNSPHMKSSPIELQIRVSPFDAIQKKIINQDKTRWISPQYKDERVELILNEPDIPTKSIKNSIDSTEKQFIKFRASDLKKDAGQSTVPFFDGLPVEGSATFPLGGIGLIHRGSNGSGGYLAFRIFDLDLSQEFKVPLEPKYD